MGKVSADQVQQLQRYSGLSKTDCKELIELAQGDMRRARFMADSTNAALASLREERPGPRKRMADPAFGRLTWDGQWQGRAAAGTLGKKVGLTVESADGGAPDERQRSAYRRYLRLEEKLTADLDEAHLRYYRKARRAWGRTMARDFLDDLAPPVASAEEVVAQLNDPTLHVPRQPRRGWEVHIRWECDWDPEHGHQVTIRDGAVRYAGPQEG